MTEVSDNRFLQVVLRWRDVLAYAACAFTAWSLVGPLITQALSHAASLLGGLSPVGIATVLLGTTFCLWLLFGKSRTSGWLGIRYLVVYPPAWLSALIVTALFETGAVTFAGPPSNPGFKADLLWFWSELPRWLRYMMSGVLGFLIVWPFARDAYGWARGLWPPEEAPAASAPETFEAISEWVREDKEIESPHSDRFEHARIAKRIAERLRSHSTAPTIAVIGPLGSGKSSVRQLTEHALRHDRHISIVRVSLWPFDSPEAAVDGVLHALVQELGKHVGTLSLVGLSDDYVHAIENSAGTYAGLARLLRGSTDPVSIVERIAGVAHAIGIRLVLWVEDLERFSGGSQLDATQQAVREVERLGPVRALLYLLDRCPAVSVVVADTSLRSRFDIEKIARFVERVPQMDESQTWRVIDAVRSACLNGYPRTFIDPAAPEYRKRLERPSRSHPIEAWLREFDPKPSPHAAIATVLSTPRSLKSALRITIEAWEALCGEIDFDSLLVASVIRVARPDVFEVLDEHIEVFRNGFSKSIDKPDPPTHPAVVRIDTLLESAPPREAAAIKLLVSFVFPKYPPTVGTDYGRYIHNPQGLDVTRHADNWRRYLNQDPVPESESDQAALKSIEQWKAGQVGSLVARVADPAQSDQVETFVSQFNPPELLSLMSDVADLLATQSAQNWEHRSNAQAIVCIWRMMLRRRPKDDAVFTAIQKIVERVGPLNLPLAHNIVHFFATPRDGGSELMSPEQQRMVHTTLHRLLVREFAGANGYARLRAAMKEGSPWTVFWSAWGLDRIRSGRTDGVPFDDWHLLSATLLTLAEQDPQTGVPICVAFITTSALLSDLGRDENGEFKPKHSWKGEVDDAAASRLFDVDRLRAAILRFRMPEDVQSDVRAHIEAAIRWANESHTPEDG